MHEPTAFSASTVSDTRPNRLASVDTSRHGAKRAFVVNMVTTIACPFVPAAQVASTVGISYLAALVTFAGLYVVSAMAYYLAANADDTFVEGTSILSAYAAQTVTYIGGPIASMLVAFYKYSNARWSSGMGTLVTSVSEVHEELDAKMTVSSVSVLYIVADLLFNLAFAVAILNLYTFLNRRIRLNKTRDLNCSTVMTSICCTSCTLFEMIWVVKDAAKSTPFHLGAIDELPPFDATDVQAKPAKTLVVLDTSVCPV